MPYNARNSIAKEIARELRWAPKIKAYVATIHGWADVYVPAESAGKARHIVVKGLRDAGYTESGQYHMIHVHRVQKYDSWAQTAEATYHKPDDMPVALEDMKWKNK